MEILNNFLGAIPTIATVVSAIYGALGFLYKRTIGKLDALASDISSLKKIVNELDDDRKTKVDGPTRSKLESTRAAIEHVNERVSQLFVVVEQKRERASQNGPRRAEPQSLPPITDNNGRIIDRDLQKIPNTVQRETLEARITALESVVVKHASIMDRLRKALISQQKWLTELKEGNK